MFLYFNILFEAYKHRFQLQSCNYILSEQTQGFNNNKSLAMSEPIKGDTNRSLKNLNYNSEVGRQ